MALYDTTSLNPSIRCTYSDRAPFALLEAVLFEFFVVLKIIESKVELFSTKNERNLNFGLNYLQNYSNKMKTVSNRAN